MTDSKKALEIYLNDHLAGATAGTRLAQRLAATETTGERVLAVVAKEIDEDRATLVEIMRTLNVPVRRYKIWLGWLSEKAGRLKPNGHLARRAELSRLIELEVMRLGVEGKAAVWRALRVRADSDSTLDAGRLESLVERATEQIDKLEALRVRAAAEVLGGPAPFERKG